MPRPRHPQREAAVEFVKAGGTYTAAKEMYNASVPSIRKWCDEAGVESCRAQPDPAVRQAAVASVVAGATHKAAAEEFGVSTATLMRWCKAEGVKSRRGGRKIAKPVVKRAATVTRVEAPKSDDKEARFALAIALVRATFGDDIVEELADVETEARQKARQIVSR